VSCILQCAATQPRNGLAVTETGSHIRLLYLQQSRLFSPVSHLRSSGLNGLVTIDVRRTAGLCATRPTRLLLLTRGHGQGISKPECLVLCERPRVEVNDTNLIPVLEVFREVSFFPKHFKHRHNFRHPTLTNFTNLLLRRYFCLCVPCYTHSCNR